MEWHAATADLEENVTCIRQITSVVMSTLVWYANCIFIRYSSILRSPTGSVAQKHKTGWVWEPWRDWMNENWCRQLFSNRPPHNGRCGSFQMLLGKFLFSGQSNLRNVTFSKFFPRIISETRSASLFDSLWDPQLWEPGRPCDKPPSNTYYSK